MYDVDQFGNEYKCTPWIIVVINTNVRRGSSDNKYKSRFWISVVITTNVWRGSAWQQIQKSVVDLRGKKYKCTSCIRVVTNANVPRRSPSHI